MIFFTIPGEPVGKGRVRATCNNGVTHVHTPENTVIYENLVKIMYMQAAKGKRLDGLVDAEIYAFYGIPKSASAKKRAAMANQPCAKKPDADNVAKAILDALNKVAYHDDSAVVSLHVEKAWSENPHVSVVLKEHKRSSIC